MTLKIMIIIVTMIIIMKIIIRKTIIKIITGIMTITIKLKKTHTHTSYSLLFEPINLNISSDHTI